MVNDDNLKMSNECSMLMINDARSVYGQKPGAGRDCGAGRDPYVPPNNSQVMMLMMMSGLSIG